MIHEHEALQLASARIDFGLSPDAERELTLSLRECPVCTERAASYHEQIRLMRRLPVLDASDATRRRVTAAAMSGRVETRSPMFILLAAALLVGLLLALTAAAGALLNRQDQDPLAVDNPSASPIGSLIAAAPSESALPLQSAAAGGAGGVFPDQIPLDTIVEVVTSDLRVRSQPRVSDDSTLLEPFLQVGDRLFVIEGPVVADDYDWYRVAPVRTDRSRGWHELPTGWVSRGNHDRTPWMAPADPECPALPVDIATLTSLHPLERVACFRNSRLSFAAVVEGGSQSGWVAEDRLFASQEAAIQGLEVAIEPSKGLGADDLSDSGAMVLEGSFDQCEESSASELEEWLDCRSTFVVSRATPDPIDLEHGDLAILLTDELQLRDRPIVTEASATFEKIDSGTRVAVVDGPAVGSGYVWYKVAVPSIRAADRSIRVGWVAVHGRDGEPWVDAEDFGCERPETLSFDEFAELSAPPFFHAGMACYGFGTAHPQAHITIEANVRQECATGAGGIVGWLIAPSRTLVLSDEGTEATGVLRSPISSIPCGGPPSDLVYHVGGHFDDDAASQCRVAGTPTRINDPVAVYECRSRFVVTELFVVGPGPTPIPIPAPTPTPTPTPPPLP